MPQAVYILFGAAFTVVVAIAAGRLMLRIARTRLTSSEEDAVAFVTGSAVLSLLVFLLLAVGFARKGIFLALGVAILAAAWRAGAHRRGTERLVRMPPLWRWLYIVVFAAFTCLYVANAMAPEISPDGVSYHLSFVARYLREHRLVFVPTNMYAQLSEGIEMLFAFAFSFGRHSAAAMVHVAFLIALALMVRNYGRRTGHPTAGAAAAILVYASPLFGIDGSSAYIDVGVGAVVFSVFYLLETWRDHSDDLRPLAIIGLLSGFAYAAKYTAALAIPYAMVYAWRRNRNWRAPAVIAAFSVVLIAPWVLKDLIWVGNPISPMMNAWFPNPVVSVGFEQEWSAMMRRYSLPTLWRIPVELTYRGESLTGFFGALFLLAPVAVAAIRYPEGRRTLLALVVFALPYPMNIGARFLIPAVPFLAIAMALALSQWPAVLIVVALLHAVSSWPGIVDRYTNPYAWRLTEIPIRAALRLEPEEAFLARKRGDYLITRAIEQHVPRGQRVWTPNGITEAYTSREILVSFQSSLGQTLTDMFSLVSDPAMQPSRIVRLTAPPFRTRQIRIEQTERVPPYQQWSIAELRFFDGGQELARRREWRITSRPNPWEIGAAFDNDPVTRWRSKQTAAPGMYIEVDFGNPVEVNRIDLLTAPDSQLSRMRVLRWDGSGWIDIRAASNTIKSEVPGFLGRPAMQEWKLRGADYMMICDGDWYAREVLMGPRFWGLTQVAERGPCHLLRNDAGLPPTEAPPQNRERERPANDPAPQNREHQRPDPATAQPRPPQEH